MSLSVTLNEIMARARERIGGASVTEHQKRYPDERCMRFYNEFKEGLALDGVNCKTTYDRQVIVEAAGRESATAITLSGITDATDLVTSNAHGLSENQPILYETTDVAITGLTSGTVYYANTVTTNTFKFSATYGGSAIPIAGDPANTLPSGTHTVKNAANWFSIASISRLAGAALVDATDNTVLVTLELTSRDALIGKGYDPFNDSGVPEYCYIDGDALYLYPNPEEGWKVRCWGDAYGTDESVQYDAADMFSTTYSPSIPKPLVRACVEFIAACMQESNEDTPLNAVDRQWGIARREYEKGLAQYWLKVAGEASIPYELGVDMRR